MMSRTYKVRRHNGSDFQGVRKEWVLVNKRGAKKFQRMVNKRCRRLDKIAIAEGINDMIDEWEEATNILEEFFLEEQYEEDPEDWYEEDPFEAQEEDLWYEEDLFDWYEEYRYEPFY